MGKDKLTAKQKKFTAKQQKFIDLYEGNGTKAARDSGYSGTDKALSVIANGLLGNARIVDAIKARQVKSPESKELGKRIASREERQAFWTKILEDEKKEMKDRLKASELLGRSEADFTEVVKHTGDLYDKVAAARKRVGKA